MIRLGRGSSAESDSGLSPVQGEIKSLLLCIFLLGNLFFQCTTCGQAMLYAYSLLVHLKQIHNITQTAKQVTEMFVKDEEEIRKVSAIIHKVQKTLKTVRFPI